MKRQAVFMRRLSSAIRAKRYVVRVGAWVCLGFIAALSLIPGRLQINTGVPGLLEHMAAYLAAAALLSLIYPGRKLLVLAALVLCSGLFEVLQSFVPGRFVSRYDAAASAMGALLGVTVAALAARLFDRRSKRPPVERTAPGTSEGPKVREAIER